MIKSTFETKFKNNNTSYGMSNCMDGVLVKLGVHIHMFSPPHVQNQKIIIQMCTLAWSGVGDYCLDKSIHLGCQG